MLRSWASGSQQILIGILNIEKLKCPTQMATNLWTLKGGGQRKIYSGVPNKRSPQNKSTPRKIWKKQ